MQKNKQNGGQLHAIAAIFALIVSTTLCFIPILFVGLLKLFPNKNWQSLCTRCVDKIATFWCGINNFYVAKAQKIHW
ncbi:TPA: acyltransferase, partial [Legionella pneumophila]|nr:acyltransferase [Legionella pneumophila]